MKKGQSTSHSKNSLSQTTLRSMRSTAGGESTTFGFSILATVAFGLLQATEGSPSVAQIFLYAFGAVMSFTILEGILSKGFMKPLPQHKTKTLALGTSLNIVSVGIGLGATLLVSALLPETLAWAVAPFAAGTMYLLSESLETALAEKILLAKGDPSADEVTP